MAHEWKPPYVADFGVPRMKRRTSLAFPFENNGRSDLLTANHTTGNSRRLIKIDHSRMKQWDLVSRAVQFISNQSFTNPDEPVGMALPAARRNPSASGEIAGFENLVFRGGLPICVLAPDALSAKRNRLGSRYIVIAGCLSPYLHSITVQPRGDDEWQTTLVPRDLRFRAFHGCGCSDD